MQGSIRFFGFVMLISIMAIAAAAQEKTIYTKNGLTFEYLKGWKVIEKAGTESDEIALSNAESDSQVTVIVLRKPMESKDPAEARKRVVDPWLTSLQDLYQRIAMIKIDRVETKTMVAGQTVDSVDLLFELDRQKGKVEACWALFEKRLVLLYMVRPDRTAEKAEAGWQAIRESIRLEKK